MVAIKLAGNSRDVIAAKTIRRGGRRHHTVHRKALRRPGPGPMAHEPGDARHEAAWVGPACGGFDFGEQP